MVAEWANFWCFCAPSGSANDGGSTCWLVSACAWSWGDGGSVSLADGRGQSRREVEGAKTKRPPRRAAMVRWNRC